MKDIGVKVTEIIIASLLTSICTICAYYLNAVNANIAESKELWRLGTYRIDQLEHKIDRLENSSCSCLKR